MNNTGINVSHPFLCLGLSLCLFFGLPDLRRKLVVSELNRRRTRQHPHNNNNNNNKEKK